MGIVANYWVNCDVCGDDSGSSRATMTEAWDRIREAGWWINRLYGVAVCTECFDSGVVYHPQYANVFCVLCQSGEHVALIK